LVFRTNGGYSQCGAGKSLDLPGNIFCFKVFFVKSNILTLWQIHVIFNVTEYFLCFLALASSEKSILFIQKYFQNISKKFIGKQKSYRQAA